MVRASPRMRTTAARAEGGAMAHSYTNLLVHIVYGTTERQHLIDEAFQPRLYDYLGGTIRGLKGVCLEIGGVDDHVHILAKLHATVAVSDFLEKLKSNSSKWGKSVKRGFGWQGGYAAFSVSESQVAHVRRYIQNQKEHHQRSSFEEELIGFLRAHNVAYDANHLWT
jgi:REP element-mobilizing transposase RayT